ncbi:MAG: short-chain fatty acyl-CoA regulator family protein [Shimia sp.]
MSAQTYTGTRIRERRIDLGMKQADLARAVQISASYLNLIEHNRRRIGGKVLAAIAAALDTDVQTLTDGAERAVVGVLRAAAERHGAGEGDRVEDFARRFPGWADLISRQATRVEELERTVASLSDRLTHDPFLSTSLHTMLSTVTSIRSTASILRGESVEPQWQRRFTQNIHEDSLRLAEAASALVAYLDEEEEADATASPQEELEAALRPLSWPIPNLEGDGLSPEGFVATLPAISTAARHLAHRFATRYRRDARALPLDRLQAALVACDDDPLAAADLLSQPFARVLRRMGAGPGQVGLVLCDASGTITFRRPVTDFALPRFGAACPLWPLFLALTQPNTPLRRHIRQSGETGTSFTAYAIASARAAASFDAPPVYEAAMLLIPDARPGADTVGASCRVCPQSKCPARREPSILAGGL